MFRVLFFAALVGLLQGLPMPKSILCPIPFCLPARCPNPRTQYTMINGVKCPMCQVCDEPFPVQCPMYSCVPLECVKTRTEYTIINGVRCPRCPVCIDVKWECPVFQCAAPDCPHGEYKFSYFTYKGLKCRGCPQCRQNTLLSELQIA